MSSRASASAFLVLAILASGIPAAAEPEPSSTDVIAESVALGSWVGGSRTIMGTVLVNGGPLGLNVTYELRADGAVVGTGSLTNVVPAMHYVVGADGRGLAPGEHVLELRVDVGNEIAESDETNNAVSATAVATPRPPTADRAIEILGISRAMRLRTEVGVDVPRVPGAHEVRYRLCNFGDAPSDDMTYQFVLHTYGGQQGLGAGSRAAVPIWSMGLSPGECRTTATTISTHDVVGTFAVTVDLPFSLNDLDHRNDRAWATSYAWVEGAGGMMLTSL